MAINEGKKKGYNIDWSNQAFEYLLYLHFYYSDSALDRSEWVEKQNGLFEQYCLEDGEYKKT